MNGKLFDLDTEDIDIYGEGLDNEFESVYDDDSAGEAFGFWGRSPNRMSAYQQQVLAARRRRELERRQEQARARGGWYTRPATYQPVPVTQGLQRAQAGIERVDLENKVQTDLFSSAMRAQRDRISGNEYALAASTLTDELRRQFPDLFEGNLGTLLPFASLLLLKPDYRGKTGFDRYITDPRILFPALALGLKLFRESRFQGQRIDIFPSAATLSLEANETIRLSALDKSGQPVPANQVTWTSQNASIATVDPNGVVTPVVAGFATIEASANLNSVSVRNQALVHVVA